MTQFLRYFCLANYVVTFLALLVALKYSDYRAVYLFMMLLMGACTICALYDCQHLALFLNVVQISTLILVARSERAL
jgi:hypothetical protein